MDQLGISLFNPLRYIANVLKIINPAEKISVKFSGFDIEDFFFVISEYISDMEIHTKPGKTADGRRKMPKKNIF